jgi:multisubunit Na+/H+ antiporter MnhG subunit
MQGKSWFKGALGMAICCGAPLLLFAAIAFFGLSLGALASGALSLVAVLACPVGMFLMMRMMMKGKKEDQSSRK